MQSRLAQQLAAYYGDVERWMHILERIAQLDIQILVPGHGLVGTLADAAATRSYLAHLGDMVKAELGPDANEETIGTLPLPATYAQWDTPTVFAESLRGLYRQVAGH
ncbi:MAG: hypothetical protein ACHQ4H_15670 [Ktedonobacterales bacterium]